MLQALRRSSAIRQSQRVACFSSLPPSPPGVAAPNFMLSPYQHEFNFTRDYENERKHLKVVAPPNFNFARDVMERWAAYERHWGIDTLALWWCDDLGNERKFSYNEIVAESKKLANALTMVAGLKQGDRVVIVLPKLYEWYICALACCRAGITMCPGTGMLSERDLSHRIELSGAKCVITDDDRVSRMDAAIAALGQKSKVKSKIVVSPTPDPATRPGWLSYDKDLMASDVPSEHRCVTNRADDEMLVYFTSGTTGLPKMVNLPHQMALGHYTTSRYLYNFRPGDLGYIVTDPGWAKICWAIYGVWLAKACLLVHHFLQQSVNVTYETLQILKKYPINTFCGAPTLYRLFLLEKLPKPDEIPHLRNCLSAGEPNNPEVISKWQQETGLGIREGYGQTETCLVACNFPGMPYRAGSMGKASPGMDVVTVDDHFKEVGVDQEGHIAIRLPKDRNKFTGLFSGYINAPLETAKAFPQGTNLYLTGDKGIVDKDGYIHFVGRADDVIITSGYRIGPFEVESALMEHSAVAESAAVSSPDRMRGEIVKAFVVLKPSYVSEDYYNQKLVKELQDHCKRVTAPYKYPRKIEFVESLPKTVSGKTRRVELREKEWASMPHWHY